MPGILVDGQQKQIIKKRNPFAILAVLDLLGEKDLTEENLLQLKNECFTHPSSFGLSDEAHSNQFRPYKIVFYIGKLLRRMEDAEDDLEPLQTEVERLKALQKLHELVKRKKDPTSKTVKEAIEGFMWATVNLSAISDACQRYLDDTASYLEYAVLGHKHGTPLHFSGNADGESCRMKFENGIDGLEDIKQGILFLAERGCLQDAVNALLIGCCLESYARAFCDYVKIKRSSVPTIEEFFLREFNKLPEDADDQAIYFVFARYLGIEIWEKQPNPDNPSIMRYQESHLTFQHIKNQLIAYGLDEKIILAAAKLNAKQSQTYKNLAQFRQHFLKAANASLHINSLDRCMSDLKIDVDYIETISAYLTSHELQLSCLAFVIQDNLELVDALLGKHVSNDFSLRDPVFGETSLHWLVKKLAALRDNPPVSGTTQLNYQEKILLLKNIIETIIMMGGDPLIHNEEGTTAFDLALEHDYAHADNDLAVCHLLFPASYEKQVAICATTAIKLLFGDMLEKWNFLLDRQLVCERFGTYLKDVTNPDLGGKIAIWLASFREWNLLDLLLENKIHYNFTTCFSATAGTLWHFLGNRTQKPELVIALTLKSLYVDDLDPHQMANIKNSYFFQFIVAEREGKTPLENAQQFFPELVDSVFKAVAKRYSRSVLSLCMYLLRSHQEELGDNGIRVLTAYIEKISWDLIDIQNELIVNCQFCSEKPQESAPLFKLLLSLKASSDFDIQSIFTKKKLVNTLLRQMISNLSDRQAEVFFECIFWPLLPRDKYLTFYILKFMLDKKKDVPAFEKYLPRVVSIILEQELNQNAFLRVITLLDDYYMNGQSEYGKLMRIFPKILHQFIHLHHDSQEHMGFLETQLRDLRVEIASPNFHIESRQLCEMLDCMIDAGLYSSIAEFVGQHFDNFIANQPDSKQIRFWGAGSYFFQMKIWDSNLPLDESKRNDFIRGVLRDCHYLSDKGFLFIITNLLGAYQKVLGNANSASFWASENKETKSLKELQTALEKCATLSEASHVLEEAQLSRGFTESTQQVLNMFVSAFIERPRSSDSQALELDSDSENKVANLTLL